MSEDQGVRARIFILLLGEGILAALGSETCRRAKKMLSEKFWIKE